MPDFTPLDHDVAAARTVDQFRREVALRLAARAGRQRRQRRLRRGWAHTAALWLVAGLAGALTALARRGWGGDLRGLRGHRQLWVHVCRDERECQRLCPKLEQCIACLGTGFQPALQQPCEHCVDHFTPEGTER